MKKPSYLDIIGAVTEERDYQDNKWGTLEEHPHSIPEWIIIIEEKMAEAKKSWLKCNNKEALKEMLQVVAVGVACIEQHGIVKRGE